MNFAVSKAEAIYGSVLHLYLVECVRIAALSRSVRS